MTQFVALMCANACWTLLGILWLALAFWKKKAKQQETPLQILQHFGPLVLGFWLVFGPDQVVAGLERRLFTPPPPVLWLGLVLTVIGVAISLAARFTLGRNWSGVVTLKDSHELIRNGVYSRMRHPIYSGQFVALLGVALISTRLQNFLGFVIIYFTYYFKARREEEFLRGEFGPAFEEHVRHTGMFLPKLF